MERVCKISRGHQSNPGRTTASSQDLFRVFAKGQAVFSHSTRDVIKTAAAHKSTRLLRELSETKQASLEDRSGDPPVCQKCHTTPMWSSSTRHPSPLHSSPSQEHTGNGIVFLLLPILLSSHTHTCSQIPHNHSLMKSSQGSCCLAQA